jgi:DNA-nicking Smr family endonuclease
VIKKKELSQEDKKAWEDYIRNPSDIYNKDKNIQKNDKKKTRYKYDLHGFTLEDANIKVREIVEYCIKHKFKELLLITGKGLHSTNDMDAYVSKDFGKLKYSVPEFLKNNYDLNKFIVSINDADHSDGGQGAIIIKLKSL